MGVIDNIKERARKNLKTIVLPESMDSRVLKAAEKILQEGIAKIILIGKEEKIAEFGCHLDGASIIDPSNYQYLEDLILQLVDIRKSKGLTYEEAKNLLLNDYMYFACMLVKTHRADGVVSGACHSSANTLRPALQIIKTKPNVDLVSAFFLVSVPNCCYGEEGTFIFADCGLEQNPTSERLASIAASSAESFKLLVQKEPMVAMLSHSTMGSAQHPDIDKVVMAVKMAKEKYPSYKIDGELQLDAAIVPEIAKMKAPNSEVAGKANVLIFPDLDAGNIGYKLVQRLANGDAFGPICQGIAQPINDLSRGCSIDDIVGVVAITAVQCQEN